MSNPKTADKAQDKTADKAAAATPVWRVLTPVRHGAKDAEGRPVVMHWRAGEEVALDADAARPLLARGLIAPVSPTPRQE